MTEWTSGLVYVTTEPMEQLEDWLDDNCTGKWKAELINIDDSTPGQFRKELKILFADDADAGKFKGTFMASPEEAAKAEAERNNAKAEQSNAEAAEAGKKKAKLLPGMLRPASGANDWRNRN
jgi:hypothetical protein